MISMEVVVIVVVIAVVTPKLLLEEECIFDPYPLAPLYGTRTVTADKCGAARQRNGRGAM